MRAWTLPGRSSPRLYLALAAALLGCGGQQRRGQTLYQDGRHIEAAEVFELTEDRLQGSDAEECACYGLYRGLNFLKLGDLRGARRWLDYAAEFDRRRPGTLTPEEKLLLAAGLRDLAAPGGQARLPRSGTGATVVEPPGAPLADQ
jgi:tetratricopeptide (TPR) repeat protein